jgi:hypothetical protein
MWWLLSTGKRPVIVYQMGRMGSTTITRSLRKAGVQTFHVHSLVPETIDFLKNLHLGNWGHDPAERRRILTEALRFRCIREWLNKPSSKKKKVVTLVRDPIGREVSYYFWDGEPRMQEFVDLYARKQMSVEQVVDGFMRRPKGSEGHMLRWFEVELNPVFGIDVYAEDFDPAIGYKIYEGEKAEVLLAKTEKLNDCAREAFAEFLGLEELSLTNANVGEDREYAKLYRAFKRECVLPQVYLDKIYTTKYVRHFYSEREIDQFRARWGTAKFQRD